MVMSKAHKWLLAWSAIFMALTVFIANVDMSEKTAILTGAIELAIAIATGIAFGLASAKSKK